MDDNIIINCCEDSYVFKEGPETTPSYKTPERPNMKLHEWELPYNLICSMANSSPWTKPGRREYLPPKPSTAMPHRKMYSSMATRICYFNLSLSRQGKVAKSSASRTFHDLRYFTRIYFPEEYFIREKRITVTIPAALSRFRLVEKNFGPGIRCEKSVNKEGDSLCLHLKRSTCHPKEEVCPRRQLPLSPSAGNRFLCGCAGYVPLAERTGRGGLHSPPSRNANG